MDYIKIEESELLNWLQKNLNEKRYIHSLGTAQCARELAIKFGADAEKCYIAGLLHDCAKCFSDELLRKIIKENLTIEEDEMMNSKTLHAPVSAFIANKEFGITDEDILSSIRWHTLGKINMTVFEKIIFLADKIEPKTRNKEYIKDIQGCLDSENGLDKSLYICYKETIKSLLNRDLKICPKTIHIYNHLHDLLNM